MKFEKVTLDKYGAIESREIDLAGKPGLVVIHGPNEAGKSTLLSAIADLLYGVPHTSPHGAVFGNNQMQIGATLRLADGSALTLRRKKGRAAGSLVDGGGAPVSNERMDTLLAGTDRNRYEALFGLDHESLRLGGQQLLAADGEIGKLIVEAGGGLRALVAALKDLEAEADTLFSPTRSAKRRYYPALDAFTAADKAVKQGTTTREAYIKAKKTAAAAAEGLSDLRQQQLAAREAINRIARLLRVGPQLRMLSEHEIALAAFANIDDLPNGLASEVPEALIAMRNDAAVLAAAEETLEGLQVQVDQLVIASEIITAADEIEAAETLALHVEKARLDLPNRLTELSESKARLDRLRACLAAGVNEDLELRAPGRAAIDRVQALAAEEPRMRAALAAAQTHIGETKEALLATQQKQSDRQSAGYDKPSPISATDLNRLPALARDIASKRKQMADRRSAIDQQLQALGLGAADGLSRQLWPSVAQVRTEHDKHVAIEEEIRQLEGAHKISRARITQAEKRIAQLAVGAEPPTPTAVAGARSERDHAWAFIRTLYIDAADQTWARPPATDRQQHAATFESSRDAADQLVDRRGAEADRIAEIASAERDKVRAEEELEATTLRIDSLRQRAEAARLAWARSWPAPTEIEGDLKRLADLTATREALNADLLQLAASDNDVARLSAEADPLLELLAQAAILARQPTDESLSLVVRVQRAVAFLKAHDDHYGDFRRDADAIASLVGAAAKRQKEIDTLDGQLKAWAGLWSDAVAAIGLSGEVIIQVATETATEWAAAAGVFGEIRLTQTRIQRIQEDDKRLSAAMNGLRSRVGIDLPDDAVAAARTLKRSLVTANGRASQRDALLPQLEKAKLTLQSASRRAAASAVAVQDLAGRCRVSTEDLEAVAARIADRTKIRQQRDGLKQSVVTAGDGQSLEALTEQWMDQDVDALEGQRAELTDGIAQRDKELEAAIAAQQAADADLKAFIDDDSLNALLAERESASSEMREIVERYIEVTLAHKLLTAAIEKVRHEQQDPLLARASKLFATCTRGAFVGIETDVNEDGVPIVVGRRQSGEPATLAEMSDGTRDQLFLAFRLASIQHYAANAEAIPLVADDVLVHFDDERGLATLELLAEVGERTQVLLFTHHEGVARAAEALEVAGKAALVRLQA